MARRRKSENGGTDQTGRPLGYEAQLWKTADALRNNMDAAEYKHVVLGLIFLKYISDAFESKHAELDADSVSRHPLDVVDVAVLTGHVVAQAPTGLTFSIAPGGGRRLRFWGDCLFSRRGPLPRVRRLLSRCVIRAQPFNTLNEVRNEPLADSSYERDQEQRGEARIH